MIWIVREDKRTIRADRDNRPWTVLDCETEAGQLVRRIGECYAESSGDTLIGDQANVRVLPELIPS